jgi:hypothetical protein
VKVVDLHLVGRDAVVRPGSLIRRVVRRLAQKHDRTTVLAVPDDLVFLIMLNELRRQIVARDLGFLTLYVRDLQCGYFPWSHRRARS